MEQFPSTPKENIVLLGDSILTDFLASPVGRYGAISRLKKYLQGRQAVMIEGYGGAKLKDYAVDSTARAATVTRLVRYYPSIIITDLAANDYQGAGAWSAASYGAAFDALLTDIHANMPWVKIIICTMVTRPSGEGDNGFGNNAADYRIAAANAAAGKPYCTVMDGPSQLWNGSNTDDDAHPNNIGSAAVFLGLRNILLLQEQ